MTANTSETSAAQDTFGFLAEYKDPTELVKACAVVRDAGYTAWDAYSPFPIHGIDPAMGIKNTRLPWFIFGAGATGTTVALLMQWWMNAVDYEFMISGKPFFSLPANIPITFELTVLFAALTAFIGVLAFNGLPQLFHPLFRQKRFARATDDGFFLAIEATDPKYDASETRALLDKTSPVAVEEVPDTSHREMALPRPLVWFLATGAVFTLVPLSYIAKAQHSTMDRPRVHVWPHMDFQEKYKTQTTNAFFDDSRAMRLPIDGTVPMGQGPNNDHFERGIVAATWATELPKETPLDMALLERGRERFNIYCSTCHGEAGYGDGMIQRRMEKLEQPTWVQPSNLHQDYIRAQAPGKLFNTITWGIRNMNGYGHAIPVEDRWAIVAYIKALQRSQFSEVADVPVNKRSELR